MYHAPSIVDLGSFAELTQASVNKILGGVDVINHANGSTTDSSGESFGSIS